MQNKIKACVITGLSLMLVIGFFVCDKPLVAQLSLSLQQASASSWTREKWNGDEKPYTAARKSIDNNFAQGDVTLAYLANLEAASEKNPQNPLKLFRWAYARYRVQGLRPALPFTTMPAGGTFDTVSSPHTYDYARVRFLIATSLGPRPNLMAVGKRLLAHSPNDFSVEYGLARCYPDVLSEDEKQSALTYSDFLINKYPNKSSVYAVKGGFYFSYWIDHRNKQDAVDAIKWYQQYLQIAPANDEWRKQAKSTISLLQSHLQ